MLKVSIIMPSYLGDYPGAASGRIAKFGRAVRSIKEQTYTKWELIVVADGCNITKDLMEQETDPRIMGLSIPKEPRWSERVRNVGITHASGDLIAYLDTDDHFGPCHLEKVVDGIGPMDGNWCYSDALYHTRKGFVPRRCDMNNCYTQGVCNIFHRPGIFWPEPPRDRAGNYAYSTQDCSFIDQLKRIGVGTRIGICEYMVCHVPGQYDV